MYGPTQPALPPVARLVVEPTVSPATGGVQQLSPVPFPAGNGPTEIPNGCLTPGEVRPTDLSTILAAEADAGRPGKVEEEAAWAVECLR